MNALDLLELMKKQYKEIEADRCVYGDELVSIEELYGCRRMIRYAEKMIQQEVDEMARRQEAHND